MKAMPVPNGSVSHTLRNEAIMADRLDTARLRDEFRSMPALCLTVEQVARLLDVPLVVASQLLATLERDGLLMRTPSQRYRLAEPFRC